MAPRQVKDKPFNGGQWTQARMKSFVMSALRRAKWPVKYRAIGMAYEGKGKNPATGRVCKLHRCQSCSEVYPAGEMQADHIEPVVPVDGQWGKTTSWLGVNWNELLPRLWCELDNYQAICHDCHTVKTQAETEQRRANHEP